MEFTIKRLNYEDKNLIYECDSLLKKLVIEDSKYDNNYNVDIKLNSMEEDTKSENNYILAALQNNKVVGFIYSSISNKKYEKSLTAKILFLYVLEEYRNKKIGSSLINELVKHLNEKNIKYLDVQVYSNNKNAINLYNKLFFNNYTFNLRKEI